MFTGTLLIVMLIGTVFAGLGNFAFFYMQTAIAKRGYEPKFLKNITDLREVNSRYQELIVLGQAPAWPRAMFIVSVGVILLCGMYMIFAVFQFAHSVH
jgi:hypothetical protein